jgi:hypothetical protein
MSDQQILDAVKQVLATKQTEEPTSYCIGTPKKKRNLTDEQRAKLSENAKNSEWNKFRAQYRSEHPEAKGREVMKLASAAYQAQKAQKAQAQKAEEETSE